METTPKNTALLVMDMQPMVFANLPQADVIVKNVAIAIKKARANNIPIIYVRVGFRQGTPEISSNNKIFAAAKQTYASINMDNFLKIESSIAPLETDIVITKRRVSAFTGSDLEVVLRGRGITHLVLTGFATSGVVLSTTREAADKDYLLTILSDCCADRDEEVHRVLTTKVLSRQADVIGLDEWLA